MKHTVLLTESDIRNMVRQALIEYYKGKGILDEGKLSRALGAAALGGALMFGNPTDANAQLNVKSQVRMEPKKLCNLSMGINPIFN